MTTVSGVLTALKKQGYTVDFNLMEVGLPGHTLQLYPNEFVVDKHYRFEGLSDPADQAIVYAISSEKYGLKGTLVNGYGIYTDPATDALLGTLLKRKLSVRTY